MKYPFIHLLFLLVFMFSCNTNPSNKKLTDTNNNPSSDNEPVNINEQQKPTIMVIPSDALLNRLECLTQIDNQGSPSYIRDYQKAFIEESDLKFAIAEIQSQFVKAGFPLEDLEQTLKSIQDNNAVDNVDGKQKDAKTLLLNTARPDIIGKSGDTDHLKPI